MTLKDDLAPFLEGRLADWRGLPELRLGDVEAASATNTVVDHFKAFYGSTYPSKCLS